VKYYKTKSIDPFFKMGYLFFVKSRKEWYVWNQNNKRWDFYCKSEYEGDIIYNPYAMSSWEPNRLEFLVITGQEFKSFTHKEK